VPAPGPTRQRFDYPVLLGLVTIVASLVIFMALACDLVYAWLDPRIQLA
jgi:ABC-type dipeptide/oligopeptide/nickel transport system permease component